MTPPEPYRVKTGCETMTVREGRRILNGMRQTRPLVYAVSQTDVRIIQGVQEITIQGKKYVALLSDEALCFCVKCGRKTRKKTVAETGGLCARCWKEKTAPPRPVEILKDSEGNIQSLYTRGHIEGKVFLKRLLDEKHISEEIYNRALVGGDPKVQYEYWHPIPNIEKGASTPCRLIKVSKAGKGIWRVTVLYT